MDVLLLFFTVTILLLFWLPPDTQCAGAWLSVNNRKTRQQAESEDQPEQYI